MQRFIATRIGSQRTILMLSTTQIPFPSRRTSRNKMLKCKTISLSLFTQGKLGPCIVQPVRMNASLCGPQERVHEPVRTRASTFERRTKPKPVRRCAYRNGQDGRCSAVAATRCGPPQTVFTGSRGVRGGSVHYTRIRIMVQESIDWTWARGVEAPRFELAVGATGNATGRQRDRDGSGRYDSLRACADRREFRVESGEDALRCGGLL
ncbi:hypothetical protein PSPO01_07505 [Paraphaeosphaeria sporulosa]